jgi:hypothetical protein
MVSARSSLTLTLEGLSMRYILGTAIAATICGMSVALAAAEPIHYAGGPEREGNMCWVSTNSDQGFGYWHECMTPVAMHHHHHKTN